MEIEKKLFDFSTTVRNLLQKSDNATRFAIESFDYLDKSVNIHKEKLRQVFSEIDQKMLKEKNLKAASKEIENFLSLVDTIEKDRLGIMQGPKGDLYQFIKHLEYINQIEKYPWIKEHSSKFTNKRVEYCYVKFKTLTRHSEKILVDEFENQIRLYSSPEKVIAFITYLINKEDDEQTAEKLDEVKNDDKRNSQYVVDSDETFCNTESKSESIEISDDSFIPKETLINLEAITAWFLQLEQQYELYNEKMEHCDINQKLKYCQMRNDFLKLCLKRYSKMNSLGFKKDSSDKVKLLMNKLLTQASIESDQISLKSGRTNASRIISNSQENSYRPVEYIELFADNLDFILKILRHEKAILNFIYQKSYETCAELTSKLTILVIDEIQKEFENFFTKKESVDFTKISNSDDEALVAIIKLIVKVQHLKEKASALQTEDLSSTSKLLMFSLKLNETSSQIFSSYLEVVKKGYSTTFELPHDSNVHEHVRNVCNKWRLIKKHERNLMEPIKIACDSNNLNKERKSSDPKSPNSSLRMTLYKDSKDSAKRLLKTTQSIEEETICEDEIEKYQKRRNRDLAYENTSSELAAFEMIQKEDFEYSPEFSLAKYYLLIEERLEEWLTTESEKECLNSVSLTKTLTRTISNHGPNFKQLKKEFQIATFVLNNFDFILEFVEDINVKTLMNKKNSNFESALKGKIESQINKTNSFYNFINHKWTKYKSSSDTHGSGRKEEFRIIIKESLEIFFKTVVLNKTSNAIFRNLFVRNLGTILDDLDLSGDLGIILKDLNIRNDNYLEIKKSYKRLTLEKIFPSY